MTLKTRRGTKVPSIERTPKLGWFQERHSFHPRPGLKSSPNREDPSLPDDLLPGPPCIPPGTLQASDDLEEKMPDLFNRDAGNSSACVRSIEMLIVGVSLSQIREHAKVRKNSWSALDSQT